MFFPDFGLHMASFPARGTRLMIPGQVGRREFEVCVDYWWPQRINFPSWSSFFELIQPGNHIFEYLENVLEDSYSSSTLLSGNGLKIKRKTPKMDDWNGRKKTTNLWSQTSTIDVSWRGEYGTSRPPEGGGCWLGWWLVFFFEKTPLLCGEWTSKNLSRTISRWWFQTCLFSPLFGEDSHNFD